MNRQQMIEECLNVARRDCEGSVLEDVLSDYLTMVESELVGMSNGELKETYRDWIQVELV